MNERDVNGNEGLDAEKARRLRLGEFLRDLVRAEGRMEAAAKLGVNYRTLVRAEESGEITERMEEALEGLLNPPDDSEVERLWEAVGSLKERVAALEGGAKAQGVAQVEVERKEVDASVEDESDEQAKAKDGAHEDGAGRSETRAAPPGDEPRPRGRVRLRRLDPELVTEEPDDDDAEVYGGAWPLVDEWRNLRAGHPHRGKSLSWLTTQERLLVLELAMLEEHGLTLPPEKQSLRGFARKGQTSWRWKALVNTRRALRRRKQLRWVRRVLTLWLWRK